MKKNEFNELRGLSLEDLHTKEMGLRQDLLSLRLQRVTKPVKDNQSAKKIRRDIARLLTVMQQKRAEG